MPEWSKGVDLSIKIFTYIKMPGKRPRSNNINTVPSAKKAKLMVDNAINKLSKNFKIKLNIPKDQYNLGTITNVNETTMGIRLSRKLVNELQLIYRQTYKNQIEHVGSVSFTVKNTRGFIKYNSPSVSTNKNFKRVIPTQKDLESYILYHSHPTPPNRNDLFTLPSIDDFRAYISLYPYVQANIIIEKNGYYVIDLIESNYFKKPNLNDVVNFLKKDILEMGTFNKVEEIYRNVKFWKSDVKSWQRVINGFVYPKMRTKFGISVRYYTYNELAPITLIDKTKIMLP